MKQLNDIRPTPAMEAAGANRMLAWLRGENTIEEMEGLVAEIACDIWEAMTEAHDKWMGKA